MGQVPGPRRVDSGRPDLEALGVRPEVSECWRAAPDPMHDLQKGLVRRSSDERVPVVQPDGARRAV